MLIWQQEPIWTVHGDEVIAGGRRKGGQVTRDGGGAEELHNTTKTREAHEVVEAKERGMTVEVAELVPFWGPLFYKITPAQHCSLKLV